MCGRFTLQTDPGEIAEHFGLADRPALSPRYNIAPGQEIAVVRGEETHGSPGGVRHLEMRRWGLVPRWAKDPAIGSRLVNARAETAATRPAFRDAVRRRRCLVPADGFYEWKGVRGRRRPFHIRLPGGRLFAIAGLFEQWRDGEGHPLETVTLLTREATAALHPIHARMPVLVDPADYDRWLGAPPGASAGVLASLAPRLADGLEAQPVGSYVNDARHEGPACLAPDEAPVLRLEDF